jgi:membrane-associated protein
MDPSYENLISYLQFWGYPIMLLLMIIEGPIVTIIASFLASLGFFEWHLVYILSVFGDIIGDIVFYFIGFFGGPKVVEKFKKTLKIKESSLDYIRNSFQTKGAAIIFYVKISTGLSLITFVLAGTMKMKFSKFLQFSFLGGLVWSAFLVALGYFFGGLAEEIEKYIKFAGWIIFSLAILLFFFINFKKKKFIQNILDFFIKSLNKTK